MLYYLIAASGPFEDYSQIDNADCGVWHEKEISSIEFLTLTANHPKFVEPNQPKHLEVNIGNKGNDRPSFNCNLIF